MLTIQCYYPKTDVEFNPLFSSSLYLICMFHLLLILTSHILFHHTPVPTKRIYTPETRHHSPHMLWWLYTSW